MESRPHFSLKIYRAAVMSKLDYTCQIYGSTCCTSLKKLDTIHHSALRICSGAFRTSPVVSLYTHCVEPPLSLTRDRMSVNFYYRILSHPEHPFKPYLLNTDDDILFQNRPSCTPHLGLRIRNLIFNTSLSNITVRCQSQHNVPPWEMIKISRIHPFKDFNKNNTTPIIFQQLFIAHRSEYNNYTAIYTDGSKSINHVGCSFTCNNKIFSFKLPSFLSIFSAEFIAIEKALNYITTHHHKLFIIYTDSESVLESLKSNTCPPTFISVLKKYHNLQANGFDIKFCWIPSHVGIKGNETADAAAKQANTFLNCLIPYTDIKIQTKEFMLKKWQNLWNEQTDNKLYQIKPIISPWPEITPRKHDVLLTRLRIRHSRITHKHLLFGEPAPMCPQCHFSILTIRHILTDCPTLRHLYRQYFKTSVPDLNALIGQTPHPSLSVFLFSSGFYHQI